MNAAFILTGMRVEKDMLGSLFDGVTVMHETSAYDQMIDQGIAIGEKKGVAKGAIRTLLKIGIKSSVNRTAPPRKH